MSAASSRLDAALAAAGLARSRTQAARLVREGRVTVGGVIVSRPSTLVDGSARLGVAGEDWVGRGALKLLAALDAFDLEVAGRLALDAGASTGGFTQVLLARGARRVIAVDVGHDQLAPALRADPRVAVVEGMNLRHATPDTLARRSGVVEAPTLVVADLSFISLTLVLEPLAACSAPSADLVVLVKPQFEAGRGRVGAGVVTDDAVRREALARVVDAAVRLGLEPHGHVDSPISGANGNREHLLHLVKTP